MKRKVMLKIQPIAQWKIVVYDNGPTAPYTVESRVIQETVSVFGIKEQRWNVIFTASANVYHEAVLIAGNHLIDETQRLYEKAV